MRDKTTSRYGFDLDDLERFFGERPVRIEVRSHAHLSVPDNFGAKCLRCGFKTDSGPVREYFVVSYWALGDSTALFLYTCLKREPCTFRKAVRV